MEMNDLDELHYFVNDLYERWTEGEISYDDAIEEARLRCANYKLYLVSKDTWIVNEEKEEADV